MVEAPAPSADAQTDDAPLAVAPAKVAAEAAPIANDASAVDAEPATACSTPKKVRWLPAARDALTKCGDDSQCVVTSSECCWCGRLAASSARAVNKLSLRNGNPYCAAGTACPDCVGAPNPNVAAVCLHGRCRARETIDPCAPRGEPSLLEQMGGD